MSIRHENVPSHRPAGDFNGSVDDELNRHWNDRPVPMEAPLHLVREAGKWALVVLAAVGVVTLLGLAFLDGLARTEARPVFYEGLRGAECAAGVAAARQ